ncbi:hypothetical protein BBO99_00008633, partial [Phytophthora kernoviae]
MRLSFMLSAAMVITYFVTCNATADSDQTKISMMGSLDLVRSLDAGQNDDAAGRRFLRAHKENGASSTEERGFSLSGLMDKLAAKKLAKAALEDSSKEVQAYRAWEANGHTLDDIKKFLNIADPKKKGKYDQLYDGYTFH